MHKETPTIAVIHVAMHSLIIRCITLSFRKGYGTSGFRVACSRLIDLFEIKTCILMRIQDLLDQQIVLSLLQSSAWGLHACTNVSSEFLSLPWTIMIIVTLSSIVHPILPSANASHTSCSTCGGIVLVSPSVCVVYEACG